MLDTSGLQLACAIVLVAFGIYHLVMGFVVRRQVMQCKKNQAEDTDVPATGPQVGDNKEEDLSSRTAPLNNA